MVNQLQGPELPLPDPSQKPDLIAASPATQPEAEAEANAEGHGKKLSREQKQEVLDLKQRDAEVRAHEQAHKQAGGEFAGSITYEYQLGPDGQRYAVGGEVGMDLSPVRGDPDLTVQKMQQIVRAALLPAEPSSADRHIAARAAAIAQHARTEQTQERP